MFAGTLPLDWRMWKMIQQYLSQEEVKKQLESLGDGEWVVEHGTQISWQNLINALKDYSDNFNRWNSNQRKEHFIHEIGRAQLLLPAHVIQEYNNPVRSMDFPEFKGVNLPRAMVANWRMNGAYTLGIDVAWQWNKGSTVALGNGKLSWDNYYVDAEEAYKEYNAMKLLLKVRMDQRNQLIFSITNKSKLRFKL